MRDDLQISDRLLTAGQPTPDELRQAAAEGWEVVINLARPDSDGAFEGEGDLCRSLGMEYVSIPVVWENPTAGDLSLFFAAMERHREKKILAHCAFNMRVSAFVFLYRVLKLGVAEDTAREDLLSIWQPEGVWAQFIEDHLAMR
jgi:protein tyrosine phosphatase (PTP) superfamily phosphohydrolase (DUF442 family)